MILTCVRVLLNVRYSECSYMCMCEMSCIRTRVSGCVHISINTDILNSVGISMFVCGEMYLCFFSN